MLFSDEHTRCSPSVHRRRERLSKPPEPSPYSPYLKSTPSRGRKGGVKGVLPQFIIKIKVSQFNKCIDRNRVETPATWL